VSYTPGFLADRLIACLLAGAALGVAVPALGDAAGSLTLLWLAVLVFATGLTLDAAAFGGVLLRPWLVALAVVPGWLALVVVVRLGLGSAPGPGGLGVLAIAAAPTEVSAVFLTAQAGGAVPLAMAAVCVSLLLAPLVAPAAFAGLTSGNAVQPADLAIELAFGVALPLVAALAVRQRSPGSLRDRYDVWSPDAGAVALICLMLGAGATARAAVASAALSPADTMIAATGILTALFLPMGVGSLMARLFHLPRAEASATTFANGMREFGVATAVAQLVAPASAVTPAVYGIVLMVFAAVMARRRRG